MPDNDNARFYHGDSMAGTFHPGDYLTFTPASPLKVRPGDVVTYCVPSGEGEEKELVHRVVAVRPDGLVARGDHNLCADATLVTVDNLLGRVTHVERGGRTRTVHGGRAGLLWARVLHTRRRLSRYAWRWAARLGRRPYRRLRASGLVRRWWQPALTQIRLNTEDGPLVKYVHAGRTVAWWRPEKNRFECRKPYDLVLPRPDRL